MKVMIINGPNINMLGIREPNIYGKKDYAYLIKLIKIWAKQEGMKVDFFQSNYEGKIIDKIQSCYFKKYDGIIINAGGYTHTSIAILDALKATDIPAVEVHLTKVSERESYRQISYLKEYCFASIEGLSFEGYYKALLQLKEKLEGKL